MPASQAGCVDCHQIIHCYRVLMTARLSCCHSKLAVPDFPLSSACLTKLLSTLLLLSSTQFIPLGYMIVMPYKTFHQFQTILQTTPF
jgi:hypothetical protein